MQSTAPWTIIPMSHVREKKGVSSLLFFLALDGPPRQKGGFADLHLKLFVGSL
jgi:hypothetical protein